MILTMFVAVGILIIETEMENNAIHYLNYVTLMLAIGATCLIAGGLLGQ